MTGKQKVIAGAAAVALVAGGGAIAIASLTSSHPAPGAARTGGFDSGASSLSGRLDGGPGPGFRSFDGGRSGFVGDFDAAASYLGVSIASLMDDLATGKPLAQVAEANGKSARGLVEAMVAAPRRRLAASVTTGRLSRAEEQALVSTLTRRVSVLVNGTPPDAASAAPPIRGAAGAGTS